MLTQVKSALPQAFNSERYPKWRTQQESRNFPFSCHDNKHILKHDISVFDHERLSVTIVTKPTLLLLLLLLRRLLMLTANNVLLDDCALLEPERSDGD
ncbi:uncharacterized protein V6R79_021131 [Siganus canaliculatus]